MVSPEDVKKTILAALGCATEEKARTRLMSIHYLSSFTDKLDTMLKEESLFIVYTSGFHVHLAQEVSVGNFENFVLLILNHTKEVTMASEVEKKDKLSGQMMSGFSVDEEFDHRQTEGTEPPAIIEMATLDAIIEMATLDAVEDK